MAKRMLLGHTGGRDPKAVSQEKVSEASDKDHYRYMPQVRQQSQKAGCAEQHQPSQQFEAPNRVPVEWYIFIPS